MTDDLIAQQLQLLHEAVQRVEDKIDKEIADLKNEQIADLKKQVDRLADDQRRLWETALKSHGSRVTHQVWITILASLSSGIIGMAIVHFWH